MSNGFFCLARNEKSRRLEDAAKPLVLAEKHVRIAVLDVIAS
jgi:hypothetical protein